MSSVGDVIEGTKGSADPGVTLRAYFVAEIQSMLHGFGDARTPLWETACLVENVVQEQMKSIINQATDVAAMRGAKSVGPEDIIFLMRKDRVKLHRLLKYLDLKDLRSNMTGILGEATLDPEVAGETPFPKKRSRVCLDFLSSIDQTGELTDTTNLPVDIVKYERTVRAERSSRALDEARYFEFVNARRASFVSVKSAPKFREWLRIKPDDNSEAPKILNAAYDLLGYMAYETVAQLVDLALLVRQDKQLRACEPLSRYMPGIGYSSSHSVDTQQIETAPPITVAEMREVMRRYWNSPVGPGIGFTRNINCHADNFLLCC